MKFKCTKHNMHLTFDCSRNYWLYAWASFASVGSRSHALMACVTIGMRREDFVTIKFRARSACTIVTKRTQILQSIAIYCDILQSVVFCELLWNVVECCCLWNYSYLLVYNNRPISIVSFFSQISSLET